VAFVAIPTTVEEDPKSFRFCRDKLYQFGARGQQSDKYPYLFSLMKNGCLFLYPTAFLRDQGGSPTLPTLQ